MEIESFRAAVPLFENRSEAGRRLADALQQYRRRPDTLVAGISRGGLVVAAEIAGELELPLDVLCIRRLETPGHDMTMGALGDEGVRVVDELLVHALRIPAEAVETEVHRQSRELQRQKTMLGTDRLPPDVTGKTVIVVDDGVASGATMDVALAILRRRHAARVIVAVPVAPPLQCEILRKRADGVVCLETPEPFFGISYWYRDFKEVADQEMVPFLGERRVHRSLSVNHTPASSAT